MKNSNSHMMSTSPIPIAMYKVVFIIKDSFRNKIKKVEFDNWNIELPSEDDMLMIDDVRAKISTKTYKINSETKDITIEYTCF